MFSTTEIKDNTIVPFLGYTYPIKIVSNLNEEEQTNTSDVNSRYKFVKNQNYKAIDNTGTSTSIVAGEVISFQSLQHSVCFAKGVLLHSFLENAERILYNRLSRTQQSVVKGTESLGYVEPELILTHLKKYRPSSSRIEQDYSETVNGERTKSDIHVLHFSLTDIKSYNDLPALVTLNWQALEDVIEVSGKILDISIIRYVDISFRINIRTHHVLVDFIQQCYQDKE
ncbi:hypothetical protein DFA_05781 [Cavenderia fasciculata]|uniref:Uncharacterized protein n=1 Tax=Cavenderia fasciculata TaxID=261658 RepID=F4PMK0_CACFS|nr:uncharacterized protein DFA_05781 [Cavenderia fasciculata]EGG23647.1 hypothetical protein DFA_05781 [Cavenderia fasciculata]|eukprot:XP_004361498.1 hypothetical protein DFA_05781 [Cavenderia fasciculata]